MNPPPAEIRTLVADTETPALIIDLDAFERNIAKLADFAKSSGIRVRPHAKTHKCTAVGLRQIAHGAVGQCVQKVGEAEALVRRGIKGSREQSSGRRTQAAPPGIFGQGCIDRALLRYSRAGRCGIPRGVPARS